ncbi:unnamed protein product [Meloidogyne enterolobii]|uniref:Uncharacterized protein n=1 Tax=Meloidogyne enterolobii TaxID=390850 RepID=A0ACB0YKW7_MELEN
MNMFKTSINEQQQQKHLLPQQQQHVLIKNTPMFLQTLNNSFTETKQLEQQQQQFVCSLGVHVSIWPSCLLLSEAFINVAFISVVMLVIVLGNLMVVLTVKFDSKLRAQRQNWLIVSLAVADFLVGLLVMPLTLLYEIIGVWILGGFLCELWLALDVLFVTASILHICIISLDRYWSVTQPLTYPIKRTPTRICVMIGVAWLVSFLISFPPLLGWRPQRSPGECSVSSELDYVLYSSLGSFYIPIAVLVMVYWRIYAITKRHSQQRLKDTQRMDETLYSMTGGSTKINGKLEEFKEKNNLENLNNLSMESDVNSVCAKTIKEEEKDEGNKRPTNRCSTLFSPLFKRGQAWTDTEILSGIQRKRSIEKRKRRLKAKERQATLLLGLILFAFIISWMPFFVIYVLNALTLDIPMPIFKFFFWLGYC